MEVSAVSVDSDRSRVPDGFDNVNFAWYIDVLSYQFKV